LLFSPAGRLLPLSGPVFWILLPVYDARPGIALASRFCGNFEQLFSRSFCFTLGRRLLSGVHRIQLGIGIDLVLVNAHCAPLFPAEIRYGGPKSGPAILAPKVALDPETAQKCVPSFSGLKCLPGTERKPRITMGRFWIVLPIFAVATLLPAQDQDFSKVQMKVTKVAGNVYMLEGAGGNIGASIGDDGIVIVDDQYAPLADKIQAALKGITDKPIRFIINTHYHGDHTGGNAYFQKQAPVIAQDNVRKRLESGGVAGTGGSVHHDVPPAPRDALPILTFDHDVTVHLNGEDIRALYFSAGHTDGDSIIFFPHSNVVHMGDDFVTYGFPFIDVQSGGSINGMIDAVAQVISQLPPDVKVIPGHGPTSSLDDMRSYLAMLKGARDAVQQALQQGKTLDQMKQAKLLDPWKKYSGDFITEDVFLETLYNSLTGQKTGKFIKHN
jgi:cyclase